jgi:hypothetical protein
LKEEVRSIGLYTLFSGTWFAIFLLLKRLILANYEIRFPGRSAAFIGALILAKVVLLLEHLSLGRGIARRPACFEVFVGPSCTESTCASSCYWKKLSK